MCCSFHGCDPVILFVDRVKFVSLEANLVGVRVKLLFSLSFLWKESQHDWNIVDWDFKP